MKDKKIQKEPERKNEEISRREAMAKIGLAAFSAATMMLLLNKPERLQAQDDSFNPDNPDSDPWP